jgi:hypothetical protein
MTSHLDRLMPGWQFRERHATRVDAPAEVIFEAIRSVRAEDIFLFRTLVGIRRGFRSSSAGILNPPKGEPLLDIATRTGFRYMANDPPREVVIATTLPHDTEAMMNFLVDGATVSTETRVRATTARGKRYFAVYWFAIRLGSGFIRRMWLRAIKRRAEASHRSAREAQNATPGRR